MMNDDGSRLRALIARRGWSVDQAAARIGISPEALKRRITMGLLSQRDIRELVRLLAIDDWQGLFFPELCRDAHPYDAYTYPDGYPKGRRNYQ